MELSGHLETLRSGHTVDSEGQFTIGLLHAREKLERFSGSERSLYLVLLVSAGISLGATSVEIRQDPCELELVFPDAQLPSELLVAGFQRLLSGDGPSQTLDLTLGLHQAFRLKAREVAVEVGGPEGRYCWQVTQSRESFEESEEPSQTEMVVRISLLERTLVRTATTWLRNLGGYASMSPACRMVDQRCEYARRPITINGQPVNRLFHTDQAPVAAILGGSTSVSLSSGLKLDLESSLEGAVALVRGEVRLVLHGVTYPGFRGLGLDGVIYVEGLRRDLMRNSLVKDQTYHQLAEELVGVREALLRALIPALSELEEPWVAEVHAALRELFKQGRLDRDEMVQVLAAMKTAPGLGGLELQRLTLLQELCRHYQAKGLQQELQWAASEGHRLALEAGSSVDALMLLGFSIGLGDSGSFEQVQAEYLQLQTWLINPEGREGTLPSLLMLNLRSCVRLHLAGADSAGEWVQRHLRERPEPVGLGPVLDLLDEAANHSTKGEWAAETGLELIRLCTERHGFRDDRLLRRYLDFRARCQEYRQRRDRNWRLGHLLTEAKFLRAVSFKEPEILAQDMAKHWAPLVLASLQELELPPSDLEASSKAQGVLKAVIRRFGSENG